MKSKILKISLITMALIVLMQVVVFAAVEKLTLKVLTDKNTYTIGDEITVTVDWAEKMQAASFKLKYDSSKMSFESVNIGAPYYNKEDGVITVNWASLEEVDYTKIVFKFKATGGADNTSIVVSEAKDFADGDLNYPKSYDCTTAGTKTIKIASVLEGGINKEPEQKPDDTTKPEQKPTDETKPEQKPTDETKPTQTTNNNNTNKKDNTVAEGKMPQTGAETTTILAILAIAAFGTVGFIGYRKLSDI